MGALWKVAGINASCDKCPPAFHGHHLKSGFSTAFFAFFLVSCGPQAAGIGKKAAFGRSPSVARVVNPGTDGKNRANQRPE